MWSRYWFQCLWIKCTLIFNMISKTHIQRIFFKKKSTLKCTVMQAKKSLINGGLRVWSVSCEFRVPAIYNFISWTFMKFTFLVKSSLLFNTFYCLFRLETNSLQLSNLKTKKAMNAKFSEFIIQVKTVIFSES